MKGTEFRVEATALGFSRVSVERGVVEVRPACCSAVVSSAPAPPAPPAPPARGATQGTAAYDAGRFSAASELLSRALAAEPSASWARGAHYVAGAAWPPK